MLPRHLVGRLFPEPKYAAPSATRICIFRCRHTNTVRASDGVVGIIGEPTEQTATAPLGGFRSVVCGSPGCSRSVHRGLCGYFRYVIAAVAGAAHVTVVGLRKWVELVHLVLTRVHRVFQGGNFAGLPLWQPGFRIDNWCSQRRRRSGVRGWCCKHRRVIGNRV